MGRRAQLQDSATRAAASELEEQALAALAEAVRERRATIAGVQDRFRALELYLLARLVAAKTAAEQAVLGRAAGEAGALQIRAARASALDRVDELRRLMRQATVSGRAALDRATGH